MRSRTLAPSTAAMPHTQMAFATWPRWRCPVGAGANLVQPGWAARPTVDAVSVAVGRPRGRLFPIVRLDGAHGRHQSSIDREEVRLRQWTRVGHGDSQEHLVLTFDVTDRPPPDC